jgi:hypothetical protein
VCVLNRFVMSVLHRLLAGVEFLVDPQSGEIRWPARTEDLLRLASELRQIVRGELALAAIGTAPESCDCGQVDNWMAAAEESLQSLWESVAPGNGPIEIGTWFGDADTEWRASARESEMDLLIVPRALTPGSNTLPPSPSPGERGEPEPRMDCPVWVLGSESNHELASGPPLIAVCDDLSTQAEKYLPVAVELALAWGARLLVVHPLGKPIDQLSEEQNDEIRREIFIRLSRSDFRVLAYGSQFRYLEEGFSTLLDGTLVEQVPNLVIAPATMLSGLSALPTSHCLTWE